MLFLLSFICTNPRGIVSGLTQDVGQGEGVVDPMWTQVGKMMEGSIISGTGDDMYESGSGTTHPKLGFPMNYHPGNPNRSHQTRIKG